MAHTFFMCVCSLVSPWHETLQIGQCGPLGDRRKEYTSQLQFSCRCKIPTPRGRSTSSCFIFLFRLISSFQFPSLSVSFSPPLLSLRLLLHSFVGGYLSSFSFPPLRCLISVSRAHVAYALISYYGRLKSPVWKVLRLFDPAPRVCQ